MTQAKSLLDAPPKKSVQSLEASNMTFPECPVGKTLKALEVKHSSKYALLKVCIHLHTLASIESFLLFAEEYLIFTDKHHLIKWACKEMVDRKTVGIALIQAELLTAAPLEIEIFIGDKRYCKFNTASTEKSRLISP
jgi:hypothetical protein